MRHDLKLLWVDDVDTYFNATKDIIEMYVEDLGLTVQIEYIQDARLFFEKIRKEAEGFKTFDMFFIDYSLSFDIVGSSLIKELRSMNIDSDILFYSSEHEEDIRKTISGDLGSFEGVYIANRKNFDQKSNYLIQKNSKRLSSLSNIRGLLTDQTSQNEFIVNSYLLKEYPKLDDQQQREITEFVLNSMKHQKLDFDTSADKAIVKIEKEGKLNMKKMFGMRNFLFTLEMKNQVFQKMLEFKGNENKVFFEDYKMVTSLRNKLAHKKLEVCSSQNHIICSDNLDQHKSRMCSSECTDVIADFKDNKISMASWQEFRKQIVNDGKFFDSILREIEEEAHITE